MLLMRMPSCPPYIPPVPWASAQQLLNRFRLASHGDLLQELINCVTRWRTNSKTSSHRLGTMVITVCGPVMYAAHRPILGLTSHFHCQTRHLLRQQSQLRAAVNLCCPCRPCFCLPSLQLSCCWTYPELPCLLGYRQQHTFHSWYFETALQLVACSCAVVAAA